MDEPKFFERVYGVVKRIPTGKVASYGQVATILGDSKLARNVGFALNKLDVTEREIPWWRVINSKGYLSIDKNEMGTEKAMQKALLRDEGIEFTDQWEVNFEKYAWNGK